MSWDIFVQHLPPEVTSIDDIPNDYEAPLAGSRDDLIARIRSAQPLADFSDPAWGVLEGSSFSIEFNLGHEATLAGFTLHVRGDDAVIPVIQSILDATGLRGIDCGTGEVFSMATAAESLGQWREYRDAVVSQESDEK